MPTRSDVTGLLNRAREGDSVATDELLPLVYDELKLLASHHLAGEKPGHTLQATALVHEAYVRLVGSGGTSWQNRAHFFGSAARAIRRILVDHARAKRAIKRGGDAAGIQLDDVADAIAIGAPDTDLVELDEALTRLAAIDPQKARVVELRFFAGLTAEETAQALGISERTLYRDWQLARAWLHREMSSSPINAD